MRRFSLAALTAAAAITLTAPDAAAQTRITLKSAAAGSSYYVMTVQLSEILRAATNGQITATVEESQGSVQNLREAPRRPGNFVFTTPPALIKNAFAGKAPFNDGADYKTVRTLWVMPPVTMHWVVRSDAGINDLKGMAGKSFVAGGRGTFTERQAMAVFKELGIADKVKFSDVELNAAVAAMRNRQIDGFASGSSHPTSHVQELAATMPIKLLSMTPAELKIVTDQDPSAAPVTIAAGTYPGQTQPVQTVGIPVGAYTTTAMPDEVAYEITKIFWQKREEMAKVNPWWNAVAPTQLGQIGVTLHPGAARYYREAGVTIPDAMLVTPDAAEFTETAAAARSPRILRGVILGAAAVSVVFHLYLIFSGLVPALVARPLHLALALPFVFVFARGAGPWRRRSGAILAVIGLAGCLYIAVNRRELQDQFGRVEGWLQYAIAIALILIVLEMARRAVKWVMPSIASIVLLYGLFGQHIPGEWGHAGLPFEFFLGTLVLTEGGLWSLLTATSVELVAPFLILGAMVAAGEAGTGFMSLAQRIAGRYRAGSAKVEVIASALYGTISGSASANVASTGTFTIPAMIKAGYPRPFAASVEAVASTGGQIMPPVMGAGIFLMASLIQIPYSELMLIASLPALLFFVTAWIGVDHYAVRLGLKGMAPDELPAWATVVRTVPFFLGPLAALIAILGFTSYTPQVAAFVSTLLAAALLLIDDRFRPDIRRFGRRLAEASINAAEQIAMIASVIICASLITGVFHMTGVGVKITSLIVGVAGDNVWVALVLTAIACIALGMELPTTAAYVICVAVAGPALIKLGVTPLQAHLFVFWYALLCTITPPVCGNVFIASSIAQTPWLPVAFRAMRLGVGLFVVPLSFIANPSLLGLLDTPLLAVLATIKIGIGLYFISYALIGGGTLWLRTGALALGALIVFVFGF